MNTITFPTATTPYLVFTYTMYIDIIISGVKNSLYLPILPLIKIPVTIYTTNLI